MSCTQEIDDLCSGEDGRLIVYEIGNNTETSAVFFFICSRITELFVELPSFNNRPESKSTEQANLHEQSH